MICPICKTGMEEGYIPSNTMKLQFIPNKNGKKPATIWSLGKNAVQLSAQPKWVSARAQSFFCEKCRIVITPEYVKPDTSQKSGEQTEDNLVKIEDVLAETEISEAEEKAFAETENIPEK